MSDRNYSVNRLALRRRLELSDRIPPEFAARYEGVNIPSDNLAIPYYSGMDLSAPTNFRDVPEIGTVVVKPKRPRSFHRVFVVCRCGREIPAGRLHQHIVACP